MKKNSTKNLVLAGLFIALGIVLPFITGQIPSIGNMLLPMHIPVLIAGFVLGPKYGLVIGFIVPLLRYMLIGMPPLFPVGIPMAFELATYGFVTGLLYEKLPKKKSNVFVSLIVAMIVGRIVWGIASFIVFNARQTAFTIEMFMAGAFLNAIPGIIIQIIIIPPIIIALQKNGFIENKN